MNSLNHSIDPKKPGSVEESELTDTMKRWKAGDGGKGSLNIVMDR